MRYLASENAAVSEMGDELAILDFETDTYFSLNSTGAFLWQLLSSPKSIEELSAALVDEYGLSGDLAERDVTELIFDLVRVGLAKAHPDASS